MEPPSGPSEDPANIRRWQRGEPGIGVLSFDGPSGSPRLAVCPREAVGADHATLARRLEIDAATIAAYLKVYPEGLFSLMLGPRSGGMSHATLRELVVRLDRRLRPASRWDF